MKARELVPHAFENAKGGQWCTVIVDTETSQACDWAADARVHQDPAEVERVLAQTKPARSPAERLRAAAKRLDQLQVNATPAPWLGPERSWAGRIAVLSPEGHPVAVTSLEDLSVTATVDAGLIAALRPLVPVIVTLLGDSGDLLDSETREIDMAAQGIWLVHRICDDTLLINGERLQGANRCTCFDDALALADAILGGES